MQIIQYDLITVQQCTDICEQIYLLSKFWAKKSKHLYTLGEAIYQNAQNMSFYYSSARILNPILWEYFDWLYKKLVEQLSIFLNDRVYFYPEVSLPGFHIFLFDEACVYHGGGCHFDIQYINIDWSKYSSVDYEKTISFTLPIILPEAGAGIDFWNLNYDEIEKLAHLYKPLKISEIASQRENFSCPYKVGKLSIFPGKYWHRISPVASIRQGDRRITLQGHCIFIDNKWISYW